MSISTTSYPTTSNYLQGNQILRVDSRIEIRDRYNNILNRFQIADFGSIADNGEFAHMASLSSQFPSFILDESLTGFDGATPLTDIDLVIISTTDPILLATAYGSSGPSSTRNLGGAIHEISDLFLLKTNSPPQTITLETAVDQAFLPAKIYLAPNVTSATVSIYMAKFSTQ